VTLRRSRYSDNNRLLFQRKKWGGRVVCGMGGKSIHMRIKKEKAQHLLDFFLAES